MPIKGLTDRPPRLPRIGKIHLGVKVKRDDGVEYPRATEYFVFDPNHPQYEELKATYGEKPKELRILIPVEDETKFAQQFYRLYSRTRGLICKGDGEEALRMIDKDTGALANRDSKNVEMRPISCQGRECPDYGPRACGETMNFQFLLPEVSGFGVWQIDTGSINSIININSTLELVRGVYGRVSMVPLILALEPKEVVNPDDGKKKTVRVLNIRSPDKMIEAYRKAQLPPLQLVAGMAELGEIGQIEAEDLPPAGDEPIHSDLPEVTDQSDTGPGTETDVWPDDGIPTIHMKEPLPMSPKEGDKIRIAETGEILQWQAISGEHVGKWVNTTTPKTVPKDEAPPDPSQAEPTTNYGPGGPEANQYKMEPHEGMSFNDLITYVKAHKKTEGWLFKTFSFNVAQAKEKPYECALEVMEMMDW